MKQPKKLPRPVDVHIGSRIRSRRMQVGKSQEWLAEKLGLTFQQVQKYEKGTNGVRGSRMQQIATALDVPPAYFFENIPTSGPAGDVHADAALRAFTTSRDGLEIVAAWEGLKPKMRSVFADLARTMAEC